MKVLDRFEVNDRLARIDKDLKRGLVSKAIDRSHGFIRAYPNNLEFRRKLGEIYFQVGRIDKAGLYWLLIEDDDPRIKEAVSLYLESINGSGYKALRDLKFYGEENRLPDGVKHLLSSLQTKAEKEVGHIPTYGGKKNESPVDKRTTVQKFKDSAFIGAVILMLILVVVFLLVGAVTTFRWLFYMVWTLRYRQAGGEPCRRRRSLQRLIYGWSRSG
ncbi:hypothetical protein CLV84_3924 [Neolewinella xylanilytica]|uniref:Tetratricopeptide repeat protein n=2 Tax=Neolewinella xylanilytica TaxID=1514080 RepID=A0A2S6I1K5_9BACT|nr:hypothetical protein CLV84_3924 [Neolewinella xylanilytica]